MEMRHWFVACRKFDAQHVGSRFGWVTEGNSGLRTGADGGSLPYDVMRHEGGALAGTLRLSRKTQSEQKDQPNSICQHRFLLCFRKIVSRPSSRDQRKVCREAGPLAFRPA